MSYEGREEYLCGEGHRWMDHCSYGGGPTPKCPICGGEVVWGHSIDDTNCDEVGIIPDEEWKKLQITPERRETCNLGHSHIVEHATYQVPTDEQFRQMEHYWDDYKYVKLNRSRKPMK